MCPHLRILARDQGSANYNTKANVSLLAVLINKVLLAPGYTHSFTCCLVLLLCYGCI